MKAKNWVTLIPFLGVLAITLITGADELTIGALLLTGAIFIHSFFRQ